MRARTGVGELNKEYHSPDAVLCVCCGESVLVCGALASCGELRAVAGKWASSTLLARAGMLTGRLLRASTIALQVGFGSSCLRNAIITR